MTVGLAATLTSNLLNTLKGTAFTTIAGSFIKLHTSVGEPGAAGTSNASANTTRVAATFTSSSAGSALALSNTPTWASWASGSETIAYITDWDASTAGTFEFSAALTASKAVANGDTLTLTSLSVSLAPIAA
jgi:hypothetical protein